MFRKFEKEFPLQASGDNCKYELQNISEEVQVDGELKLNKSRKTKSSIFKKSLCNQIFASA